MEEQGKESVRMERRKERESINMEIGGKSEDGEGGDGLGSDEWRDGNMEGLGSAIQALWWAASLSVRGT